MEGFSLLTCFQVEYGIPSGPGAVVGEHLERAVAISSFVSGGAFLSGRNLGGGREWILRGGKVVQQDVVHLLRCFSPVEGEEAGRGSAIGKLLGRPQGLGGGA